MSTPTIPIREPEPAIAPLPSGLGALDRATADEAELSDLLSDYAAFSGGMLGYVVTRPLRVARMLRLIARLPIRELRLPGGGESAAVQRQVASRLRDSLLMRGTRAVLVLPGSADEYLLGSSRQTVRRKARAAERAGVSWHRVTDPAERVRLREIADEAERSNPRPEYRIERPDNGDLLELDLWLVATDALGAPLMLVVIPTAGEWSTLRYFRTLVSSEEASLARYFMMPVLVDALASRGVRYLVDSARAQWLPAGLRHFQRMVGFRLIRLRPHRASDQVRDI